MRTGSSTPAPRAALPAEYSERALYVAAGEIEARGQRFGAGKMLVFDAGEDSTDHGDSAARPSWRSAASPSASASSSGISSRRRRTRIEQAKADWRAGRMKLPDFDNQEFIPLA